MLSITLFSDAFATAPIIYLFQRTERKTLLFKWAWIWKHGKFTWIVKLLLCWSACKCNHRDLIFSALSAYTSVLWIDFLGNFPSVRLVDQQRRQIEVIFYSRYCIIRSGVGILAREIRLAMTVVVESWITHYSLDPMVWPSNFHCLD